MTSQTPQVLQEIQAGQGIGMADVAASFPGFVLDPSTPFRWTREGVTAPSGRRVVLASVRVGKRVLTSRPAVERFILETTGVNQTVLAESVGGSACG